MTPASVMAAVVDQARALGLAPGAVHLELVPPAALTAIAAYDGLPDHYRHWSFGRAVGRIRYQERTGLARLYEVVVNTAPPVAYVRDDVSPLALRVVTAHVLGHVDFFGRHQVLAAAAPLLGPEASHLHRLADALARRRGRAAAEQLLTDGRVLQDLLADGVVDWRHPANIMGFVAHEGVALEDLERQVLQGLEREARIRRAQRASRIANEGWATIWHRRILAATRLPCGDALDYARLEARLMGATPGAVNPYRLGWALWREGARRDPAWCAAAGRWVTDRELAERFLTPAAAADVFPQEAPDAARRRLLRMIQESEAARLVREGVEHGRLRLRHVHDGRDLAWPELPDALASLARLWGGPVELATVRAGHPCRLVADGRGVTTA